MSQPQSENSQEASRKKPKCCLGTLYYSQTRHDNLKPPLCMGFAKGLQPGEDMYQTNTDHIPGGDFKYLCFGYSAFDAEQLKHAAQTRTSQTDPIQLPYCEGLEIVSAAAMSEKPELLTGGPSLESSSSTATDSGKETRNQRGRTFTGRPDVGGVPEGMDWDRFKEKFDRMAGRIVDKMSSNAGFMAQSVKKSWQQLVREFGGSDKHDR